jgi:uncharacterized protein YjbK
MSQNIEIEFKNMLTKEEYDSLFKVLNIMDNQVFTQENHYFDTPEFALKDAGSALRIRRKMQAFEMTLKQPAPIGLLETNQTISMEEADLAFTKGILPSGIIQQLIEEKNISFSTITYFGMLTTNRVEIPYKKGLLVLDHSSYLNKEDYELEFEVTDYEEGKQVFTNLLTQFSIPERKTENKIRRFYSEKVRQEKQEEQV